MADISYSVDVLKKFKVVELKAKLQEVGLPISGTCQVFNLLISNIKVLLSFKYEF